MTYPTITPLPDAPSRSQSPDDFSSTADAFVAALPDLVTEVNAAGDYIDTKTVSVGNDFQGTYSAGTTYTTGQSVLYSDVFYLSLVDSNTGNTPDSSPSEWVEIVGSAAGGGGGGTVDFTASGAISNGDLVSLNSDGTISVSVGEGLAETTYLAGEADYSSIAYDSTNEKVVIVYRNPTSPYSGYAVVGTVSGGTISFGTPVVYSTNRADYNSIAYDANSGKVVIVYSDDAATLAGKAVVGTVSGTSISFGSPVTFGPNYTYDPRVVYDSVAQKVVVSYRDGATSDGEARVGTVSGTSISFGTAATFADQAEIINSTYDANAGKVVIVYRDASNNYGTARVGTVSGTSISFGTAVVFQSAYTTGVKAAYDSTSNKVVVTYNDSDASYVGKALVGTVSGTSISFGTAVTYNDASNTGDTLSVTYDSNANKIAILHRGSGNSALITTGAVSGTSISFDDPVTVTDPTMTNPATAYDSTTNQVVLAYTLNGSAKSSVYSAGNNFRSWVGFAAGDISNGATGSVTVVSGVNEGQTGLTTGVKYFLDGADGSLTTTSTTGREVGRALSATKLLVTQGSIS